MARRSAAHADDVFIGSAPLAFTFGLGAAVLFPLRVGASSILLEQTTPTRSGRNPPVAADHLLHRPHRVSRNAGPLQPGDIASLRICVSAGETLPKPTWDAWHAVTGITMMDGIGSTEMLHIFIGAPIEKIRPGAPASPSPATKPS